MKKILFLAVALLMIVAQQSSAQATIVGNTISTPTDYLGSSNAQAVLFLANAQKSGWIDYQTPYNTSLGYQTLNSLTTGHHLSAFGYMALFSNTAGYDNTGNGSYALYSNDTGYNNVAAGAYALYHNLASENTGIGYGALYNNNTGRRNTATGLFSLYHNTTGTENTADGWWSMVSNVAGSYNTGIGYEALYNATGDLNTAVGDGALYFNTASENTATGGFSLYLNTSGVWNTADGFHALYTNTVGSANTATGFQSLYNSTGTGNTADGMEAVGNTTTGSFNSAVGDSVLISNNTGSYNAGIGYRADVKTSALNYATAIGATAIAATSHQMELGENNATVTVGLSNVAPTTPVTKLEIATQWGASPFTFSWTHAAPYWVNSGRGEGWSGLRFDDLRSLSHPGKNPGPGYLSVDSFGNVIYVDTAFSGSSSGIGSCSNPTTLTANGAIDMANVANFYFLGNNHGTGVNNVAIGLPCSSIPIAKLHVLQHSGNKTGSIGIYVENDDSDICPTTTGMPIGIKSYMTNNPISTAAGPIPSIAGWFEAPSIPPSTAGDNYSIFVPGDTTTGYSGGVASFGFFPPTCSTPFSGQPGGPTCGVQVADNIYVNWHVLSPSDRNFKTRITPLTNALRKIDSINAIYYYYDTVAFRIRKFSSEQQAGFVAQNIYSVFPQAAAYANGYYSVDYARMTPLLLAGIQEQQGMINRDSIRSINQQQTIDSLKTVLANIQSCLNSLCGGTGGNGSMALPGKQGSTQDITLSGSTSAPLLYQNAPNPFSTGTKINYYLPEGTTGATIVFYDTYGNLIKTIQLNQTGNGTLNITPDNLSNGIYSYSLIVGGSVIDTKRMLLQK